MLDLLGDASFLVMPSIWYETFGHTIMEAYAKGTPAIASRIGALAELVDHDRLGLLFEPGAATDLAAKVREFLARDAAVTQRMRRAARDEFTNKYMAKRNYQLLMDVYADAAEVSRHKMSRKSKRRVLATP